MRWLRLGGVTGILRHPKTIILYSIAERARVRSAANAELAACKTLGIRCKHACKQSKGKPAASAAA